MRTSHHVDGPGSFVLSGPGARPTFVANDNLVPSTGAETPVGLVLAVHVTAQGEAQANLQMLHRSGRRTNALLLAHDDPDLIALWRGLGRDLGLPLYLIDDHGRLQQVTRGPGEISHDRRAGSPLSGRRTRTAQRRHAPLPPFTEKRRKRNRQQDQQS